MQPILQALPYSRRRLRRGGTFAWKSAPGPRPRRTRGAGRPAVVSNVAPNQLRCRSGHTRVVQTAVGTFLAATKHKHASNPSVTINAQGLTHGRSAREGQPTATATACRCDDDVNAEVEFERIQQERPVHVATPKPSACARVFATCVCVCARARVRKAGGRTAAR